MKISIIGAGNGGCAFAGYLASIGQEVTLYGHPEHAGNLSAIQAQGGLIVTGKLEGHFTKIKTTTDISYIPHISNDHFLNYFSHFQKIL